MLRTYTMEDGVKIAVAVYTPPNKAQSKGHIHLLHGMAEHQGRYRHFASKLASEGYYVTSHDHRGHGETAKVNDAPLGYFADTDGFSRITEDVREVLLYLQQEIGVHSTTLFGHSMGSFVARRFIQKYSEMIDRVILCGTGATTSLHVAGHQLAKILSATRGKQTPSKLMNDLSFGSFNKGIKDAKTNFDWLSTCEDNVSDYMKDPNCGFIATNQFFTDLTFGLMTITKPKEVARIRKDLPILFIAGEKDPVGNYGKGVYKVAKQMEQQGVQQVVVFLFENMRHEIINEKNKQHVHNVVIRWLEKYE